MKIRAAGALGRSRALRVSREGNMSLLGDDNIAESAAKSATCRVKTAGTKLTPDELATLEQHCRDRETTPGELIRQLILDELARDSGEPSVSPELIEILGLRLMLTNLLRPLATGQKITPEIFDGVIAEVKKHKRNLAVKTRTDLERT